MLFTYMAKFGVSAAYNSVYYANDLFPVLFSSTSFGVCNVFGGLALITSVYVTTLKENVTFVIFTALAAFAVLLSLFIKENTNKLLDK